MLNDTTSYEALLGQHIKDKRVVYVDVPVHFNFGDYLIYLGSRELIKKFKPKSCKHYSCIQILHNFRLISEQKPDVIICHGGGNFGDLYDRHNNIRLEIVKRFPDIPIVFFPQTVFYKDENRMIYDLSILDKHKNLKIYVRDFESKTLIEKYSNIETEICCDTAHFLYQNEIFKTARNRKDLRTEHILVKRKDEEKVHDEDNSNSPSIDWDHFFSDTDIKFERVINYLSSRLSSSKIISNFIINCWVLFMDNKSRNIVKYFSKYKYIKTDRLHGYIFGFLLDMDRTALDNNYGKISRYIKEFKI